jgi:hypothetical protein
MAHITESYLSQVEGYRQFHQVKKEKEDFKRNTSVQYIFIQNNNTGYIIFNYKQI